MILIELVTPVPMLLADVFSAGGTHPVCVHPPGAVYCDGRSFRDGRGET